jgi:hypothetical protein
LPDTLPPDIMRRRAARACRRPLPAPVRCLIDIIFDAIIVFG